MEFHLKLWKYYLIALGIVLLLILINLRDFTDSCILSVYLLFAFYFIVIPLLWFWQLVSKLREAVNSISYSQRPITVEWVDKKGHLRKIEMKSSGDLLDFYDVDESAKFSSFLKDLKIISEDKDGRDLDNSRSENSL